MVGVAVLIGFVLISLTGPATGAGTYIIVSPHIALRTCKR
jgi:hypothetical protein